MSKLLPLLLLSSLAAAAHEIGTTRVSAMLEDSGGAYNIVVVTDAASLLEKLETVSGRPLSGETRPEKLQAMLSGFDDKFRQRVAVRFGEYAARPDIAYSVAPGADPNAPAAVATIRLTGQAPQGAAGEFTWKYSWTFATYSLMTRQGSSAPVTEWLEGGQASKPFSLAQAPGGQPGTALRYLILGFSHIVPHGLDHVLFVLGIYLLSGRARTVLWQVSAFTLAHSITLALSIYGVVSVPSSFVEPLIALSIAYVAVENIFLSELKSWRIVLVFTFGLLHGMGFAGVLSELGLPPADFATALVTFNLGVEAGQLAVIAAAFLLLGWRWSGRVWYRARVVIPASAMIAVVAVYWTIERIWF